MICVLVFPEIDYKRFSPVSISYEDTGLPKPTLSTKACSFLLNFLEGIYSSPYEDLLNDGFKIELNEMPVLVCFHCSNFSFRWGRRLKNVENLQKTAEASPALGQWLHKAH